MRVRCTPPPCKAQVALSNFMSNELHARICEVREVFTAFFLRHSVLSNDSKDRGGVMEVCHTDCPITYWLRNYFESGGLRCTNAHYYVSFHQRSLRVLTKNVARVVASRFTSVIRQALSHKRPSPHQPSDVWSNIHDAYEPRNPPAIVQDCQC
jgi:hypothetical protein